jgi:hypothetical protein
MAISDVFPLAQTPECLNAYYTRAARVVEMFEGAKNLPTRTWRKRYEGQVSTYDITGKGVQSRILNLEQRRVNARFCTDWQMWHNGCEPQDFSSQTVARPGLSEKWAHLMHMQKKTCYYHLETIAANTMNLPKRLEQDMNYLMGVKNDVYAEYFQINHLAQSDRRFMAWKLTTGPPATYTFGDKVPGAPTTPPFRWGTDADGCRFCGEKLFLAPGITPEEVQPLMSQSLQILQAELANSTAAYTLNQLSIITDAFTKASIIRNDDSLVNALLYKAIGSGSALNPSLAANHNIIDFFTWDIDPLPWRGYYDPDQESVDGEACIVRIDPFLDLNIEEGLESDMNPDYNDPNIAAFQIDVPWIGPTYSPMRAIIPERVGRVSNHAQTWAAWEWINNKDMENNPHGDKGYFSLRDNMLATPEPLSRRAPIILSRRAPFEFNTFTLPELGTPTATSATSTTDCESIQWKQNDPYCTFDAAEGYGYDMSDGGCAACQ